MTTSARGFPSYKGLQPSCVLSCGLTFFEGARRRNTGLHGLFDPSGACLDRPRKNRPAIPAWNAPPRPLKFFKKRINKVLALSSQGHYTQATFV